MIVGYAVGSKGEGFTMEIGRWDCVDDIAVFTECLGDVKIIFHEKEDCKDV